MSLIYHILDKVPAADKHEMQHEYEVLAAKLASSGQLRIDTDYSSNFIRYHNSKYGVIIAFSNLELTQSRLLEQTKTRIQSSFRQKGQYIDDENINNVIEHAQKSLKKITLVPDELRQKLSRIFVQSAHPIVIRWLLLDFVEVFITYSYNIGDVMDIATWSISGTNSGMQSTDGQNVCIYVSLGGDPFAGNIPEHPTAGDGWPALARLQIIAAQEIGHYADIIRDKHGRQISRHSADFACTRAKPNVAKARKQDIKRCQDLRASLAKHGLKKLISHEKELEFFRQNNIWRLKIIYVYFRIFILRRRLLRYSSKHAGLIFLRRYTSEKYMGMMIDIMLQDMLANLTPAAGVYKRNTANETEAVACVEALARVPQQALKWGYLTTKYTMSDLYKIYYRQVIPSLIKSYNDYTGKAYKRNYEMQRISLFKRIFYTIFGPEDDNTEKTNFVPVRELYSTYR